MEEEEMNYNGEAKRRQEIKRQERICFGNT